VRKSAPDSKANRDEVPAARMPKGEVLRWNAVSSRSTCGKITISRITANVPSRTTHAAELILREATTLERYFLSASAVNFPMLECALRARGGRQEQSKPGSISYW
jgi:hypothetical protein